MPAFDSPSPLLKVASRKSAQAEELPGSRKKESALKEKERVMERAKERGGGLE